MLRRLLRLRRGPVESFMDFNRRTAARINNWQQKYNVKTLVYCVLKALFKAAWRQHLLQPNDDGFPLRVVTEFRNAAWWETIQCLSTPTSEDELVINIHVGANQLHHGNILLFQLGAIIGTTGVILVVLQANGQGIFQSFSKR